MGYGGPSSYQAWTLLALAGKASALNQETPARAGLHRTRGNFDSAGHARPTWRKRRKWLV
ncbi:hypothetical protein MPLDJ20_140183 [Mesorhizobium plurifarium]|uniref:Uncharacterized protein n=1 Tax=Mesorhizobium plurifarium TaxID=69974 RepID=A0A090EK08_MESPL|nr:hypothetical protein MPLDJ20_140183 [Mesorhizobium plurifarium]CDX57642.1 hypothetical protein MPL3365_270167 [Mesorhizobium plurifarium]